MHTDIIDSKKSSLLFGTAIIAGLYVSSLYSYVLFRSLIEAFCVFVSFMLFILAWNTRRIRDNQYLPFISIASLFFGALGLLHAIADKVIGVLPGEEPDLAVQLWIASHMVFSLSFLVWPPLFSLDGRSTSLVSGWPVPPRLCCSPLSS